MKRKIKEDLTGRKFNKWKVLYQADDKIQPSGKHRTMWHCVCECGNEKDVDGSSLKSGMSTSCGCVLKEWLVNSNSKINRYDLSGDFGVCYFGNGGSFLFDKEDYPLLKQYYWGNCQGYAASTRNVDGKSIAIRAHRLIMGIQGADSKIEVDHINGNPSDNRKANLRIVSHADNMKNRKLSSRNKYGYVGIKETKIGKWTAMITVNGKNIWLGTFDSKDEAVQARIDAENKYFGEFKRNGE